MKKEKYGTKKFAILPFSILHLKNLFVFFLYFSKLGNVSIKNLAEYSCHINPPPLQGLTNPVESPHRVYFLFLGI
jgi:3-methyladenine DNA glycosylase AlkC